MTPVRHRPRVVVWNNQPSPYVVRRLNALRDRGRIEPRAWFNVERAPERSWTVDPRGWRFPARYLGGRPPVRACRAAALLMRDRPDLLFTLYEDAAFATVAATARALHIPVVLRALRTFPAWRSRSAAREAAKRILFPRVSGIQVAGADSAEYVSDYGARAEQIFPIREEIDLPFWLGTSERAGARRDVVREHASLEGCVFLCVGRLWSGKGLDTLLEAYAALAAASSSPVSLLLVGDGPDEARYRARAGSLPNVVFAGFAEGADLAAWYAAADVFVFPTLGDPYGHVIQEAMACGLPVIASTAAGDIEDRVVHGSTGYLVPPGHAPALARRMAELAADADSRVQMGTAARRRVLDWSTENWANGFEEMVFDLVPAGSAACAS